MAHEVQLKQGVVQELLPWWRPRAVQDELTQQHQRHGPAHHHRQTYYTCHMLGHLATQLSVKQIILEPREQSACRLNCF